MATLRRLNRWRCLIPIAPIFLSFLSGGVSGGGRYAPQSGEIGGILKQLKDEMSANLSALEEEELDRKTNHQGLMKAKTEEISVLTKAIEEKTVRQGTLAVEVEKMKSELSEAERTLLADEQLASKLAGNCTTQASEWEVRQRMRAEELVASQETIKLLNDDDSLELFKETLPSPGPELQERGRPSGTCSAPRFTWISTRQFDIHGPQW